MKIIGVVVGLAVVVLVIVGYDLLMKLAKKQNDSIEELLKSKEQKNFSEELEELMQSKKQNKNGK
jgi:hypothetical protein